MGLQTWAMQQISSTHYLPKTHMHLCNQRLRLRVLKWCSLECRKLQRLAIRTHMHMNEEYECWLLNAVMLQVFLLCLAYPSTEQLIVWFLLWLQQIRFGLFVVFEDLSTMHRQWTFVVQCSGAVHACTFTCFYVSQSKFRAQTMRSL